MRIFIVLALVAGMMACGDGAEEGAAEAIDTSDVKGTIVVGEMELSKNLQLNNNEGKFNAIKVKDDSDNEFTIYPSERSLEDIRNEMNKSSFGSSDEYEILKDEKNLLVYELTNKKFGSDEIQKGYGFALIIPAKGKNYLAESNGETPFDPILDKSKMEALLKVAQSFKPE
jgi:hypothetical protein